MWLTEYTADQMHNLRTRIKRRKEALRKTSHLLEGSSSKTSSEVEADWQFVNFNPCMYGPRKSLENGDTVSSVVGGCIAAAVGSSVSGSLTNLSQQTGSNGSGNTTLTSQNSNVSVVSSSVSVPGSTEDFYEFPTSTNLKQIVSPSSSNPVVHPQQSHNNIHSHDHVSSPPPEGILVQKREKDAGLPNKSQHQKYLRHSINAAFDLLPNPIQVQGQQQQQVSPSSSSSKQFSTRVDANKAKASSTDSVVVTVSKSNSILSTSSSSSSVTSISASSSGFSSNPVSRSSSTRCTPPVSQSKFYIPSPSAPSQQHRNHHSGRPPPPLPREPAYGLGRPHSWDVDSGALIINGKEIIIPKKRKEDSNSGGRPVPRQITSTVSAYSPGTSQSNLNSENVEKRKRNSGHYPFYNHDEQSFVTKNNRKIPTRTSDILSASSSSSSKPKYIYNHSISPMRIPHPPPLPSYSLEECLQNFPAPPPRQPKGRAYSRPPPPPPHSSSSAFNRVSAVGSLCLSLINPNHACMFIEEHSKYYFLNLIFLYSIYTFWFCLY